MPQLDFGPVTAASDKPFSDYLAGLSRCRKRCENLFAMTVSHTLFPITSIHTSTHYNYADIFA
jgi:hypothetical protein